MLFVSFPWVRKFKRVSDNSHKILDILPLETLDINIIFLKSMMTNHKDIDDSRHRILDYTMILVNTINHPHSK